MKITQLKLTALALLSLFLVLGTGLSAQAQQGDNAAFVRGAKVWADNCMRCHNARDPQDFRADQWKVIMSHMRIQAGLTGSEARDTLKFLVGGTKADKHQTSLTVSPTGAPGQVVGGSLGASSGQQIYLGTCIACHGADGKGTIPGVPDFTAQNGRLTQPDAILQKHIAEGFQSPGSSMAMPPKGGDPNLGAADIENLLKYMRGAFIK